MGYLQKATWMSLLRWAQVSNMYICTEGKQYSNNNPIDKRNKRYEQKGLTVKDMEINWIAY